MRHGASDNVESGFTLLETLVAFMILSIALAGSIQVLTLAARQIALAEKHHYAEVTAEELRLFDTAGTFGGRQGETRIVSVLVKAADGSLLKVNARHHIVDSVRLSSWPSRTSSHPSTEVEPW